MKNNPGTLLILGNGFDLDLGFKTSYTDFYNNCGPSEAGGFPFVKGGCDFHELGQFILDAFCVNK